MNELIVEPYLHAANGRLYNPLTDRSMGSRDPGFSKLSEGRLPGPRHRGRLLREGWLVEANTGLHARFRLKYVSLEGQTTCNQRCSFCPVSLGPRDEHVMDLDLYERIASQLVDFPHLEGVFMNHYNEPTVNRDFLEHVRILNEHSLPIALLTNATGLSPKRCEAVMERGGVAYLCVNLSTVDREEYAAERSRDHLPMVLKHLDHIATHPVAPRMEIVVLGATESYERVREHFDGTPFVVRDAEKMDRAGAMSEGLSLAAPIRNLGGCMQTGSRPLQHLHVNAYADCILCCQDYRGGYVAGNLAHQTVREVLEGAEMARLRRWTYGLEEAPDDFICRKCVYAIQR